MRQDPNQTTMKFRFDTQLTKNSEGYEVSRYKNFLKSVSNFELAQRAVSLISIVIEAVGDMREPFRLTNFYCFSKQCIRWSLVKMTGLRS